MLGNGYLWWRTHGDGDRVEVRFRFHKRQHLLNHSRWVNIERNVFLSVRFRRLIFSPLTGRRPRFRSQGWIRNHLSVCLQNQPTLLIGDDSSLLVYSPSRSRLWSLREFLVPSRRMYRVRLRWWGSCRTRFRIEPILLTRNATGDRVLDGNYPRIMVSYWINPVEGPKLFISLSIIFIPFNLFGGHIQW